MKQFSNSSKWQSNRPEKNSAPKAEKTTNAGGASEQVYGYRNLRIWGKAMEIARLIYDLTDAFPREERMGLGGQLRRTAVAVPSLIAEGYSRMNAEVFQRTLEASLGSLAELETQLELARSLNYISDLELCRDKIFHERSMIQKILKKGADPNFTGNGQGSLS